MNTMSLLKNIFTAILLPIFIGQKIVIIPCVIDITASKHNINNINSAESLDYLVFGIFREECFSDSCQIMYKFDINSNKVYFDNSKKFWDVPWGNHLQFDKEITNNSNQKIVQKILSIIPPVILQCHEDFKSFGACPGCGDGYVLYLETRKGKQARKFFIDYNTLALTGEIKHFAEELKKYMIAL